MIFTYFHVSSSVVLIISNMTMYKRIESVDPVYKHRVCRLYILPLIALVLAQSLSVILSTNSSLLLSPTLNCTFPTSDKIFSSPMQS